MNDQLKPSLEGRSSHVPDSRLWDFFAILLRGKWLLLAVYSATMACTGILLSLVGPIYESTASVLINTRMAQAPVPLFLDQSGAAQISNTLQNELEVMKSRSLSETVRADLLTRKYLDASSRSPIAIIQPSGEDENASEPLLLDRIIKRFDKSVSFEPVPKTDVVRITAKSTNPQEAALVANTFAKAYKDRNMNASRAKSKSVREYLQAQVKDKQQVLAVVEDSLKKYMEQKGVVSLDDESKKIIDQLSALKANRDAVDIQIHTLEKTLSSYQEQLTSQEKDFSSVIGESNDPYIRLLQEQLAKLEVQRDVTATQNPTLVGQEIYGAKLNEIDAQIAALRKKLQTRTDQFLKTILPSSQDGSAVQGPADYLQRIKQKILEAQIETQSLQAKRTALDEPIKQYEAQFERIPAKSLAYARLERDRQSTEKLYLLLDEKFNQASLMEQSEFGSVDIFDPAIAPIEPSTSRTSLALIVGSVLGVGAGLALVFLGERLNPKIHLPQDVRKLGYSLLSTIGQMKIEVKSLTKGRFVIIKKRLIDVHIVTITNPRSIMAESYRQLRTNLRFGRGGQTYRTILLTSSKLGEGKSTTVANLAVAFADDRKRVLLVDADLRRPVLHSFFDLNPSPGLSDFLVGDTYDQVSIRETIIPNLNVVPCGKVPPNPSELLGSHRMKEFLDELRPHYDVVLIDSSPVLAVTDPCVLSSFVDEVIIVVAAGSSSNRELERTIELLKEVHEQRPTIVLNNFNKRSTGVLMSGGYGYGYGYAEYMNEADRLANKGRK